MIEYILGTFYVKLNKIKLKKKPPTDADLLDNIHLMKHLQKFI